MTADQTYYFPVPEYWLSSEPSAIDDHAAYVDSLVRAVEALRAHRQLTERTSPMGDKFLDQLKAEVEAANAAKAAKAAELAAAQKEADQRGKAFLDKVTKSVTDRGGKKG